MRTGIDIIERGRAQRGGRDLSRATHPEEILENGAITEAEKRAALASWASDAHAIEGVPDLRQLDSGAIVRLDDILSALRRLDAEPVCPRLDRSATVTARPRRRGRLSRLGAYVAWSRRRDDDDDPPPSPVALAPPRHGAALAVARQPGCGFSTARAAVA